MPPPIVPILLCGGAGVRLWPLSTDTLPKQFLSLKGTRTMLEDTARRALEVGACAPNNLITVTAAPLASEAARQLTAIDPACARHILTEPSARHTGAAVAFAALYARTIFGDDALLWIMPTDHIIDDPAALAGTLRAGQTAAENNHIVAFGIAPTHAETGYGYIEKGPLSDESGTSYRIARFVEKPASDTAESFFQTGRHLWNSGMILCRTFTLLTQFRLHAPSILAAVEQAINGDAADPTLYAAVPTMAFDRAVMERTQDGVVVPLDAAWTDIGSWDRLWRVKPKDDADNACTGRTLTADTTGCLIESHTHRLIACAGLRDLVIVDTGDTVLVADRRDEAAMAALTRQLDDIKENNG